MNAESDKLRASLDDQLSSLEARLESKVDDVQMLTDIQDGIGQLLGKTGANEAEIRRVLQDRYESGDLRKETFQLVKSMLDRFVTEHVATSPGVDIAATVRIAAPVEPPADALLVKTVPSLPDDVVPIAEAARQLDVGEGPLRSTQVLPPDATPLVEAPIGGPAQVGSVLRDRFLLQERIAGGSMGVVYKALDRRQAEAGSTEPWVAIKVLSPELASNAEALRALQQEANKGRCLTHPNIVRFIDLDRDDTLYFIVMEWLDGRTLADILDSPETRTLNQAQASKIVTQIGDGLSYAHRCGIVHADVKPGNVMLTADGKVKLFDFGVARVQQAQHTDTQNFDPGVLGLLTPAYSSMQVLTGEEPTPADDVFSLACLYYRLLAGYRVFGPRNAAEAADEGMEPQKLPSMSDAQWRVLRKALSYSRVTRFETMDDFMQALDVNDNDPITITVPVRDELTDDDTPGALRYVVGLVVLIGLIGGATYQFGLVDEIKNRFLTAAPVADLPVTAAESVAAIDEQIVELDAIEDTTPATEVRELDEPVADGAITETVTAAPDDGAIDEFGSDSAAVKATPEVTIEPVAALVDFSQLPAADVELRLGGDGRRGESTAVRLREEGRAVTVDLIRTDTAMPMALRLEEIGFSGNRSPWVGGQFTISDDGFVEFPAGQERARISLSMTSDPLREADQQSTLRIREVDSASAELATITVNLEDDDQRRFEANLPANTVAFAVSQISVRERDPAVQIDVLRFNPDDQTLIVAYALRDITATQGVDYFAPSSSTIEFGPRQRSARILIPLVQDFEFEDNEAFSVELSTADSSADVDIYLRTAIIIRDDDS